MSNSHTQLHRPRMMRANTFTDEGRTTEWLSIEGEGWEATIFMPLPQAQAVADAFNAQQVVEAAQ